MVIRSSDGGGLLGTPLPFTHQPSTANRNGRATPADAIAPTRAIYDTQRTQSTTQTEQQTGKIASIEQILPPNLHVPVNRPKSISLHDVMDDDDRRNLHAKTFARRRQAVRRAHDGASEAASQTPVLPFALATTDVPTVIPKEGVPYLPIIVPTDVNSASTSSQVDAGYGLAEFLQFAARNKTDKLGLGHDGSAEEKNQQQSSSKPPHVRHFALADERVDTREKVNLSDDDDDLDEFANFGYRNLDATAKRLKERLKKARHSPEIELKRGTRNPASKDFLDPNRELFSKFARLTVNVDDSGEDSGDTKAELPIPEEFARNPVHDPEKDIFRRSKAVLPATLQKEYNALADVMQKHLETQQERIQKSIDKVNEKEDESLREMKAKFAKEMQTQFVSSSEGSVAASKSAQTEMESNLSAKLGQASRTVLPWEPSELLCKLLGVTPEAKPANPLKRKRAPLPQNDDEMDVAQQSNDGFRIQRITSTGGKVLEPGSNVAELADEDVVIGIDDESSMSRSHAIGPLPREELYTAIFNPEQHNLGMRVEKIDDVRGSDEELESSQKTQTNKTNTFPEEQLRVRLRHKTRKSRWDSADEKAQDGEGSDEANVGESKVPEAFKIHECEDPRMHTGRPAPIRRGVHKSRASDFF